MSIIRMRGKTVAIVAVAALSAGAIAYAAWVANGSGSATAKAGTAIAMSTSDASASTSATLYPGASGELSVTINNPNPYPVRVTEIAAGEGSVTSSGGTDDEDCDDATGVSLVPQNGLAIEIGANDSTTATIEGAVQMDNSSADGCQGATFTVPVAVSGVSAAS